MESLYRKICYNVRNGAEAKNENNSLIEEILAYIEEHYYDMQMSLTVLAEKFGMSPLQMSNFFKEQTGENYHDYISKLRVRIAKSLLAEGKLTIEEVSRQIGYGSVITFRRIFKKYEKLTPHIYRQVQTEGNNA